MFGFDLTDQTVFIFVFSLVELIFTPTVFFKLLPLTQSWELTEFLRELAPNPEMVWFLVERVSREKIVNYTWQETLRFKVWEFLGHLWVK